MSSHVFRQSTPNLKKPWKQLRGKGDECLICHSSDHVTRSKFQLMMPMCTSCRSKFVRGEITAQQFISHCKPTPVQPMDTGRTLGRIQATKGSLSKELGNARWIACSCGRKFKTIPFKSGPEWTAWEKWIRHSRGEEGGHRPVNWSDRNPQGEAAVISRLWDEAHNVFKK